LKGEDYLGSISTNLSSRLFLRLSLRSYTVFLKIMAF